MFADANGIQRLEGTDLIPVTGLQDLLDPVVSSISAKFDGARLWRAITTTEAAPGTTANVEVTVGSITIANAPPGSYLLLGTALAYHATTPTVAYARFYAGATLLAQVRNDLVNGLGLAQSHQWNYDHLGGTVTFQYRLICPTAASVRQTCGEGLIVARLK